VTHDPLNGARWRVDHGDALDVLVLSQDEVVPGALVSARIIGVMPMVDQGQVYDKIIAVMIGDPMFEGVRTLDDAHDLAGKTALVRVDFNVPMEDGKVTDDTINDILKMAKKYKRGKECPHCGMPQTNVRFARPTTFFESEAAEE